MALKSRNQPESQSSVAKALRVFSIIGLDREAELAEIAARTGYPKSTLLRLIQTMIREGLVHRTAHGRYQVTIKAWRIGAGALDYQRLTERVVPILHWLVEATGETAHYSIYDDGSAIYIEKIDGTHPVRAYTQIGGKSPAHASATGKALLAWQDESEIRRIAKRAEAFTESTHIGVQSILEHSAEIRRLRYAVNRGEWRADVWGVGAPVFGTIGRVEAAVGISGPAHRIRANLKHTINDVITAADRLSEFHGSLEGSGGELTATARN